MLAIFNKELKAYFKSPIGYVFMAFFLFVFGYNYALINLEYASPNYSYVIGQGMIIVLFGIPIITMRLLCEEKKQKTDQLLLTAPIKVSGYILGKYFASVALFGITLFITILQPISLIGFGELPISEIIGSYIGYMLLATTFISIGLFISSLTENQIVSIIITFVTFIIILQANLFQGLFPTDRQSTITFISILVALVLLLIYYAIKNIYLTGGMAVISYITMMVIYFIKPELYDGFIPKFFKWISIIERYETFNRGVFSLSSVIYYISISIFFIFLTTQMVEKRRWS